MKSKPEKEQAPQLERGLSEVRTSRNKITVGRVFIAMLLFALLLLFIYTVTENNAELRRSKEALEAAQEELRCLLIDNGQLERYSDKDNLEDYLDRYARDVMGYADPQERVYRVQNDG